MIRKSAWFLAFLFLGTSILLSDVALVYAANPPSEIRQPASNDDQPAEEEDEGQAEDEAEPIFPMSPDDRLPNSNDASTPDEE